MPAGLRVGDNVLLPVARVSRDADSRWAIRSYKITSSKRRSIRVDLGRHSSSDWIATSAAHKLLGVYLVRIGDLSTEDDLLDPLLKSILQYSRLLLPDDHVRAVRVRSLKELQYLWRKEGGAYSHVALIGHGRADAIRFGIDEWARAEQFGELFEDAEQFGRVFVSLCCSTGRKPFAAAFSSTKCCSCLIAPFQSVHGAIASQFCQTFLAYHLLEGRTATVAYNRARSSTAGSTKFRLWRKGTLC